MTDVDRINAMLPVKWFFKWKDGDDPVNGAGNVADTFFSPCPDLGGDEVDDGDALSPGESGESEIESGKIDKDQQ